MSELEREEREDTEEDEIEGQHFKVGLSADAPDEPGPRSENEDEGDDA